MVDEQFNGYRIDSLLGEGGIGQVYSAEHLALRRPVALKVLLEKHEDTPMLRKRFEREAKALSGLNHPHIVSITDVGVSESGTPFLVMELLEGCTLSHHLATHAVDPETAFLLTSQLLSAMAYAHERGIAHRDLKPQNIFVQTLADGSLHLTVLDFGLVRFLDEGLRNGTKLTRKGAVLGTPAYMAPEQAAGGEVDERADVYAAGLIFFEALAGRRPFMSKSAAELRRAHLTEPPPRLSEADPGLEVGDALEEFMERALAKYAGDRFENAQHMLAALEAMPPGTAKRVTPEQKPKPRESSAPDADADTVPALGLPSKPAGPAVAQPPREAEATTAPPDRASRPIGRASTPQLASRSGHAWRYAAAAVFALVFLGAGGAVAAGLLHFLGDESPEGSPEDSAVPTSVAEETPLRRPGGHSNDVGGVNPFAQLPEPLRPLHDKVMAGNSLTRAETRVLNRWGRAHPGDARSRLLLGRHFTEARSLSWALPQYQEALEIDPTTRAWPPMLEDLLEMVRSRTLSDPASDLIADTFGEEALPALRTELQTRRRRDEVRRLEALLERLSEPP